MLTPLRIDVASIQAKQANFDPAQKMAQIEALANTIVDLNGLINLPKIYSRLRVEQIEIKHF